MSISSLILDWFFPDISIRIIAAENRKITYSNQPNQVASFERNSKKKQLNRQNSWCLLLFRGRHSATTTIQSTVDLCDGLNAPASLGVLTIWMKNLRHIFHVPANYLVFSKVFARPRTHRLHFLCRHGACELNAFGQTIGNLSIFMFIFGASMLATSSQTFETI